MLFQFKLTVSVIKINLNEFPWYVNVCVTYSDGLLQLIFMISKSIGKVKRKHKLDDLYHNKLESLLFSSLLKDHEHQKAKFKQTASKISWSL